MPWAPRGALAAAVGWVALAAGCQGSIGDGGLVPPAPTPSPMTSGSPRPTPSPSPTTSPTPSPTVLPAFAPAPAALRRLTREIGRAHV